MARRGGFAGWVCLLLTAAVCIGALWMTLEFWDFSQGSRVFAANNSPDFSSGVLEDFSLSSFFPFFIIVYFLIRGWRGSDRADNDGLIHIPIVEILPDCRGVDTRISFEASLAIKLAAAKEDARKAGLTRRKDTRQMLLFPETFSGGGQG